MLLQTIPVVVVVVVLLLFVELTTGTILTTTATATSTSSMAFVSSLPRLRLCSLTIRSKSNYNNNAIFSSTSLFLKNNDLFSNKYYNYNNYHYYYRYQTQLYSSTTSESSSQPEEDDDDNKEKARIVFLGTPDVAATSLRRIVEKSKEKESMYEVVSVITQPPKRRSKKAKITQSPVGLVAEELGIPLLTPEKAKDTDFLDEFENTIRPDLCITAAYGQYLPKRFLATPTYGTLNIHPSLLPKWRGASPVQRSLEAGDNPVGVTVLYTISKMDAGPIIAQTSRIIDCNDQASTVLPYLFDIGTSLLLEYIPKVLDGVTMTMEKAQEQNDEDVSYATMIDSSKEGELCIWKESAKCCHDRTRGFSMWPGTYLYFTIGDDDDDDKAKKKPIKVKVIRSRVIDNIEDENGNKSSSSLSSPTKIVTLGPKKGDGLRVVCGDGSILELLEIQPVTRKVMDAKSFVNGLRGRTLRWVENEKEKEEG